MLQDDSRVVRRELSETLARLILCDEKYYPILYPLFLKLCRDLEWWVRLTATIDLGLPLTDQLPDKSILRQYNDEAIVVLEKFSCDEDWGVRVSSVLASTVVEPGRRGEFVRAVYERSESKSARMGGSM